MWLWLSVVKRLGKVVKSQSTTATTIMPILLVTYTPILKNSRSLKSVIKLPSQECTNILTNASATECSRLLESKSWGQVIILKLAALGSLTQLMDNVLEIKELATVLNALIEWLRPLKQSKPVACTNYLTPPSRPTSLSVSLPVLSHTIPLLLAISNASIKAYITLPMSN